MSTHKLKTLCGLRILFFSFIHISNGEFVWNHPQGSVGSSDKIKNEFQFLIPGSITFADSVNQQVSSDYSIDNISPLLLPSYAPYDVIIQFSSTNQSNQDWIGAYSPGDVDITSISPVKIGYCSDSSSYLPAGQGSLRFRLTNYRSDVSFYFFRGGLSSPVVVNKFRSVVQFQNINEPIRPRISALGDPDKLLLSWSSNVSEEPVLKWGLKSRVYTQTAEATTSWFQRSDLFGPPATTVGWRDFHSTHRALISGILSVPTDFIFYIFGDANTSNWSAEHILRVPRAAGTSSETLPTSVVVYGDMGRAGIEMLYFYY